MNIVDSPRLVVGGVDTHLDTHVAAVVDSNGPSPRFRSRTNLFGCGSAGRGCQKRIAVASNRSVDGRRQFEGLEVVIEAASRMELIVRFDHPYPILHGSTRGHSPACALYRDPRDGSLWADGYDVRRTLREVTESEASELRQHL